MSPDLLWQLNRTCLEKQSYNLSDADSLVDMFASRGKIMFYYKCNLCARYHLTSKEPTVYNDVEHYKVI